MFCNKCGKEISDNTIFCSFCGGKQGVAENVSPQVIYRQPIMESKTVQIYPSEDEEKEVVKLHEKCGWTLLSSNRVQEDTDNGNKTSTFTRLVFQRNKNVPNYQKIKELSEKGLSVFDKVANTTEQKKRLRMPSKYDYSGRKLHIAAIVLLLIAFLPFATAGRQALPATFAVGGIAVVVFIIGLVKMLKERKSIKEKNLMIDEENAAIRKTNEVRKEIFLKQKQEADEAANECEQLILESL